MAELGLCQHEHRDRHERAECDNDPEDNRDRATHDLERLADGEMQHEDV